MNKKLIVIISAVLVVLIAGGTAAFLLLRDRDRDSEEEEFLPTASDFEVEVGNLKFEELTFYFLGQENPLLQRFCRLSTVSSSRALTRKYILNMFMNDRITILIE